MPESSAYVLRWVEHVKSPILPKQEANISPDYSQFDRLFVIYLKIHIEIFSLLLANFSDMIALRLQHVFRPLVDFRHFPARKIHFSTFFARIVSEQNGSGL